MYLHLVHGNLQSLTWDPSTMLLPPFTSAPYLLDILTGHLPGSHLASTCSASTCPPAACYHLLHTTTYLPSHLSLPSSACSHTFPTTHLLSWVGVNTKQLGQFTGTLWFLSARRRTGKPLRAALHATPVLPLYHTTAHGICASAQLRLHRRPPLTPERACAYFMPPCRALPALPRATIYARTPSLRLTPAPPPSAASPCARPPAYLALRATLKRTCHVTQSCTLDRLLHEPEGWVAWFNATTPCTFISPPIPLPFCNILTRLPLHALLHLLHARPTYTTSTGSRWRWRPAADSHRHLHGAAANNNYPTLYLYSTAPPLHTGHARLEQNSRSRSRTRYAATRLLLHLPIAALNILPRHASPSFPACLDKPERRTVDRRKLVRAFLDPRSGWCASRARWLDGRRHCRCFSRHIRLPLPPALPLPHITPGQYRFHRRHHLSYFSRAVCARVAPCGLLPLLRPLPIAALQPAYSLTRFSAAAVILSTRANLHFIHMNALCFAHVWRLRTADICPFPNADTFTAVPAWHASLLPPPPHCLPRLGRGLPAYTIPLREKRAPCSVPFRACLSPIRRHSTCFFFPTIYAYLPPVSVLTPSGAFSSFSTTAATLFISYRLHGEEQNSRRAELCHTLPGTPATAGAQGGRFGPSSLLHTQRLPYLRHHIHLPTM